MYKHILISTDGSDVAQKGVDHGLDLAKAVGAKVTIVMVAETVLPFTGSEPGLSASVYVEFAAFQLKAAEDELANAVAAAREIGVEVDTVCIDGSLPAEGIIETAKARNSGLIVMSSHGRRGLRRLFLGSVTSEVLANSSIPVLVVR